MRAFLSDKRELAKQLAALEKELKQRLYAARSSQVDAFNFAFLDEDITVKLVS